MAIFEQVYNVSKEIDDSDSEETIGHELELVRVTVECMEQTIPSDYQAQYRAWRPSAAARQEQPSTPTDTQPASESGGQQQSGGASGQQDQGGEYENPNIIVNEADRGTVDVDGFFTEMTEEELHTHIANPYDGYGEVQIGYGGDTEGSSSENSEERGTTDGWDSFGTNITEEEAHTHTSDPYSGYGEIQIGYGG